MICRLAYNSERLLFGTCPGSADRNDACGDVVAFCRKIPVLSGVRSGLRFSMLNKIMYMSNYKNAGGRIYAKNRYHSLAKPQKQPVQPVNRRTGIFALNMTFTYPTGKRPRFPILTFIAPTGTTTASW